MKKIIITGIICCLAVIVFGQSNKIKIKKNKHGIIEHVKFPSQTSANEQIQPQNSTEFFKKYLETTNFDSFVKEFKRQKNIHIKSEHYDQYYKGIKVVDRGYNLHYDKGKISLAHGHYVKINNLSITPAITSEKAKQLMATYLKIPIESVTDFKAELIIKEISTITGKDTIVNPFLVYRVYLYSKHPNNDKAGFIDAQDGRVLLTELSKTAYSSTATFATRYNESKQATTEYYNGNYNLNDLSRDAEIHTWDLDGSTFAGDKEELTDSDNNWTSGEYSASKKDMGLDIHWALQQIYDYFYDEYLINSLDDAGLNITAYFDYGSLDNDKDNAFWDKDLDALFFGEGANIHDAVASLDAVAHEYGHGLSYIQIGWPYTDVRAAFHEGLSDIWAVILENRIAPNSIWEIGEQIVLNNSCQRNIQYPDDPDAYENIADTYLGPTYNDASSNDYVKSGVFSRWFYLLVNGGSGTNENNYSYTVNGIGMDAAEKLIVQSVFENYFDNKRYYQDIRISTIDAAESNDLFGENSYQVIEVKNAWYAVGVGSEPTLTTVSGSDLVCYAGSTFTANDPPSGSTISWTVSSNLTVQSGGSTTTPIIRASTSSSNGAGWVQANFTSNGHTSPGPRMDVLVGAPIIQASSLVFTNDDDDGGYFCTDVIGNDVSWTYNHDYLYFDVKVTNISGTITYHTQRVYNYTSAYLGNVNLMPGMYMVGVQGTNSCGTGNWALDAVEWKECSSGGGGLGFFSVEISPNPIVTESELMIVRNDGDLVDDNITWKVEVYDFGMNKKYKSEMIYGKKHKLKTYNWKKGIYVIRAYIDEEIVTKKFIKK